MARFPPLRFRRTTLDFTRPYIAGVANVTPDSFSDGGIHDSVDSAVSFALRSMREGADVVDVGGESTRPRGAEPVPAAEEIRRVVPVIRALSEAGALVSVDTTKAAVAEAAIDAGAEIVNDVSGGLFDPELLEVTARRGAAYVCGHVRGATLAEVHAAADPSFEDVCLELARRLAALPADLRQRTVVDPGIGFGKSAAVNLELIARAGELGAALARPVMIGASRKRFLGELTGRADPKERDDATVGASLAAVQAGADFVRVHDVARTRDALVVFTAIGRGGR